MKAESEFEKLLLKTPDEWWYESLSDVSFDKYALDEAVANQSQRFTNYAGLYSKANKLKGIKEAEWDEVKGEVDLAIRKSPRSYDIIPDDKGKVMEASVKAAIGIENDVIQARRGYLLAKEYDKLFEKIVQGFEHRRAMIRLEAELYLKEYYSMREVKETQTDDFRKNLGERRRMRERQR